MSGSVTITDTWERCRVGDLFDRVSNPVSVDPSEQYQQIGVRSHCRGIFHKTPVTGKQLGNKRVFWVQPDCLVLNIVFAWEHAVALTTDAERGMIASHRFPMYTPKEDKILLDYAYLHFSSTRGRYELGVASPGGAGRNKTLGQEEFLRLTVNVPPLEYQAKAMKLLGTWDEAVGKTDKLIQACKLRKKALMQELLTGKNRFRQFGNAGKNGELPDNWTRVTLEDVAEIIFSGVDKKSHPDEIQVRLCNYTDVYHNEYITSHLNFMQATATQNEIEKCSLKKGDVVITKDSETPDDIANPAIVSEDLSGVICGYHLGILRPKADIDGHFLGHLLMLPLIRHQFSRIANGATRYGLTLSSIRKVPLWMPEKNEQEAIARVLRDLNKEITDLVSTLDKLKWQRRGFIQKLLSGQIDTKA